MKRSTVTWRRSFDALALRLDQLCVAQTGVAQTGVAENGVAQVLSFHPHAAAIAGRTDSLPVANA